jgi:hypothetical protein
MADNGVRTGGSASGSSSQKRARETEDDVSLNARDSQVDADGIVSHHISSNTADDEDVGPMPIERATTKKRKGLVSLVMHSKSSPTTRESIPRSITIKLALHKIIHASRHIGIRNRNTFYRLYHYHLYRRRHKILEKASYWN